MSARSCAVIAYLWRDSWSMVYGLWRFIRTRRGNPGIVLLGLLILGTIPVLIAGYLLREMIGSVDLQRAPRSSPGPPSASASCSTPSTRPA